MPETTRTLTTLENRFISALNGQASSARDNGEDHLSRTRKEAMGHFSALGFPNKKEEAWKYTDVLAGLGGDIRAFKEKAVVQKNYLERFPHIPDLDAYRVVSVNGRFTPRLSDLEGLPEGVVVSGLLEAASGYSSLFEAHFGQYARCENEAFVALNTALFHDGLFIYVPNNLILDRPIHLFATSLNAEISWVPDRNRNFLCS